MTTELYHTIEQIGREKGLDTEIIIQALEEAYAAATRKYQRSRKDLGARLDLGVTFQHQRLDVRGEVVAAVDINPHKWGKYMVGSGHPIVAPAERASSWNSSRASGPVALNSRCRMMARSPRSARSNKWTPRRAFRPH